MTHNSHKNEASTQSFIIRLWSEPSQGVPRWRVTLKPITPMSQSPPRTGFTLPDDAERFLAELLAHLPTDE